MARALWDVIDSPSVPNLEPWDQLSGMDDQVLQVIDFVLDRDRGSPDGTISRFRSGWADQGFDLAALDQILTGNGIPIA